MTGTAPRPGWIGRGGRSGNWTGGVMVETTVDPRPRRCRWFSCGWVTVNHPEVPVVCVRCGALPPICLVCGAVHDPRVAGYHLVRA